MTTVALIDEQNASGAVGQVYAEIRSVFGLSLVLNMFKVMAHNPGCLKASWERVKVVMGSAHTAALKGMGCGDAEIVELMSAVDLFSGLNMLRDGLQVTPDLGVSIS
jgi:hypothetical protein